MYHLPSQFLMVAEIGPFEGKVSILVKSKGFHKGFPLFYIRENNMFLRLHMSPFKWTYLSDYLEL